MTKSIVNPKCGFNTYRRLAQAFVVCWLLGVQCFPASTPLTLGTAVSGSINTGELKIYRVTPTATTQGFRVMVEQGSGLIHLYVRKGQEPENELTADFVSTLETSDQYRTLVVTNTVPAGESWFIGMLYTDSTGVTPSNTFRLMAESPGVSTLNWDAGTVPSPVGVANPSTAGGDYFYKVIVQNTSLGAWRAGLRVETGDADLYLRETLDGADLKTSARVGSDGFVVGSAEFEPGRELYLVVHARQGATWRLFAGEVFAHRLGEIVTGETVNTNVVTGPEGMVFFQNTVPADTQAWGIWAQGSANLVMVKKSSVPLPAANDLEQVGKMLVVPDYLGGDSSYFTAVVAAPGETVRFYSRKQLPVNFTFSSNTALNVTANTFPYRIFRVQVPIEQIAWEVNASPVNGDPNFSIRRDKVGNEWQHDAYSEAAGSVTDSITLAPPTLSDGVFYITVYGDAPYNANLANAQPAIETVPYVFQRTNDQRLKSGWKYYRVTDIQQQLGTLGWDLILRQQVPGTRIAIRRNAVPAIWQSKLDRVGTVAETGHFTLESSLGFLQDPNHPADIWYVGVYSPDQALGDFQLEGRLLEPAPVAFNAGAAVINGLQPGRAEFFKIVVPQNALGWEVRLHEVSSGIPSLLVRHQLLPQDLLPAASGRIDWTGWTKTPEGAEELLLMVSSGLGGVMRGEARLLDPGTYYVAVKNIGTEPLNARLLSRGIGQGLAIPVQELSFSGAGSSATITALPAREAAYFRVTVPANAASWKVKLTPTRGDGLLLATQDRIPGVWAGDGVETIIAPFSQGKKIQKPGNEHLLLLPYESTDAGELILKGGTYFLAVVSEGVGGNPAEGKIGSGTADFTITSQGAAPVAQLGTVTGAGLTRTMTLEGAESALFQYDVPAGTPTVELTLENVNGFPMMHVVPGDEYASAPDGGFASQGGNGLTPPTSDNQRLIIAPPAAGKHSVTISALPGENGYVPATFTLRVRIVPPQPLPFDGGTLTVDQPRKSTRFFTVDAPNTAVVWDLRLRLSSAEAEVPQLRARFGKFPGETVPFHEAHLYPEIAAYAGSDFFGYTSEPDGTPYKEPMVLIGMEQPLLPGKWYVAVTTGEADLNYTLTSRGVGPGFSIPLQDLAFTGTGSSKSFSGLAAREFAYYKVTIPASQPSWRVKLDPTAGEAALIGFRDWKAPTDPNLTFLPHQYLKLQKPGDEHFTVFPDLDKTTLTPGIWYFAVGSEGAAPADSRIGTGSASYTLTSSGPAAVTDLGNPAVAPRTHTAALEATDRAFYTFDIPAGVTSLEVQLENVTGNPLMLLSSEGIPPSAQGIWNYGALSGYQSPPVEVDLITVANPPAGRFGLMVIAANDETGFAPASYRLTVRAVGNAVVALNGGNVTVTGQAAGTWKFFVVNVPNDPKLLGWDLRLENISGAPQLYVERDSFPSFELEVDATGGLDYSGRANEANGEPSRVQRIVIPKTEFTLNAPTYYVGVYVGPDGPAASYTLRSRGIGDGYLIPVREIGLRQNDLAARDAHYYKIVVPEGTQPLQVDLRTLRGDAALLVTKDFIPALGVTRFPYDPHIAQKGGEEHFAVLPTFGRVTLEPGTYYFTVVSEGVDPLSGQIGSGSSDYEILSRTASVQNLLTVPAGGLNFEATILGGDHKFYSFNIPEGLFGFEVQLLNRVGEPRAALGRTNRLVNTANGYGYFGGEGQLATDPSYMAVPNATAGNYTLSLFGSFNPDGLFPDATTTVRIRPLDVASLAPDPVLANANLPANVSGELANGQSRFYRVEVPQRVSNERVLGWRVDLSNNGGAAIVRARKNLLPDNSSTIIARSEVRAGLVVEPVLSPGTWYLEVKSTEAIAGYTIQNRLVTDGSRGFVRTDWVMPPTGVTTIPPGLEAPYFGDSGFSASGTALSGDLGTDLGQGLLDFYAVTIPEQNSGLLRTELLAISGTPQLYIREVGVPSLSHAVPEGSTTPAYHRSLVDVNTLYGNWVPIEARQIRKLRPGRWALAVHAAGNSNARYRLRVASGNAFPAKQVQTISYGQTFNDQLLARGDWRYYRLEVPRNAPVNLNISFTENSGNVVMYLRDTVPPGHGTHTGHVLDWRAERQNVPFSSGFDTPGTHSFSIPPIRPGAVYYIGFRAETDARFSVTVTGSGPAFVYPQEIAFYGGKVQKALAPHVSELYVVNIPLTALGWTFASTNGIDVPVHFQEGTVPLFDFDDLQFNGGTNVNSWNFDQFTWPFSPGNTIFILATNHSDFAQPLVLHSVGLDTATDHDADGLPDIYELRQFNSTELTTGAADYDRDGVSNAQEMVDGTDPTDPSSFKGSNLPAIRGLTFDGSDRAVVTVEGRAGRRYRLEASQNLSNWEIAQEFTAGQGTMEITDQASAGQTLRFYRLLQLD